MKPMAFNLRDAKKVKTDGKTSTFKLGSGHEITILHKALPALQRKQIEKMPCCDGADVDAMAEGGKVDSLKQRKDHEIGVNLETAKAAGHNTKGYLRGRTELAKGVHSNTLDDLRAMKKPNLPMAKGGEIKPPKMEREDKGHGAVIHKEDAQSKELERMRKENDDLHKKIMEAHEHIMKMANGGDVLPKHMKPPKNPKMEAVGINGHAAAYANGGAVHGPCKNPNCPSYGKMHPNCNCYANGGKIDQDAVEETTVRPDAGFGKVTLIDAEGGETPDPQQPWSPTTDYDKGNPSVPQVAKENYKKDTTDDVQQKYGKQPVKMYADPTEPVSQDDSAPLATPDAPPPAQAPVEPTTAMANMPVNTQVPPTPANANVLAPDNTVNAPAAVNLQQQGAREQQAVDSAKGAAVANIQDGFNKQRAALAQRDADNLDNLKGHAEDFKQYINENPINPNHYMESKSTLNKVGTAVTLFLGGLGAGMRGGSNPALDFINRQIDRDIDSQKARADQQRTIWGAYKDLYGDDTIANNMAKISLNDITTGKMNQAAAQLATPAAKANADAFSAQKAIENQQLLLDSSGRLGQLGGSGGAKTGKPTIAKPSEADKSAAAVPKEKQLIPADEYADSPILKPGAEGRLNQLRYTPQAKDKIDQISEAYRNAYAADHVLGQLHSVMQDMHKNAIEGGTGGYLRRHDPVQSLPYVGEAAHKLIADPVTDNAENREYDTNKSRIVGDLANALKGTNVGQEEIKRVVDANSPEHGDDAKAVAKKERAIRIFIKNATLKDQALLKDWKVSK